MLAKSGESVIINVLLERALRQNAITEERSVKLTLNFEEEMMKAKIFTVVVVIVLSVVIPARGLDVDFYEDGVIQNGDEYYYANVYNDAMVDVTGGFVYYLHAYDTSTLNIFSGSDMRYLKLKDLSTAHLHGGLIEHVLSLDDTGTAHFYGYDFHFDSLGGSAGQGFLTGYWVDSSPFEINLHHWNQSNTYNLIFHEIPEPSSLILFALGTFLLKRKQ